MTSTEIFGKSSALRARLAEEERKLEAIQRNNTAVSEMIEFLEGCEAITDADLDTVYDFFETCLCMERAKQNEIDHIEEAIYHCERLEDCLYWLESLEEN